MEEEGEWTKPSREKSFTAARPLSGRSAECRGGKPNFNMIDPIRAIAWLRDHPSVMGWIAVGSALTAVLYTLIIVIAITRMDPEYFASHQPTPGTWRDRHSAIRFLVRGLKGLLGIGLLLAGIAMLVLPGQGLLTILVAISLLEFPGKRRLELTLVRRRSILGTLNWIRNKAGRKALVAPGKSEDQ